MDFYGYIYFISKYFFIASLNSLCEDIESEEIIFDNGNSIDYIKTPEVKCNETLEVDNEVTVHNRNQTYKNNIYSVLIDSGYCNADMNADDDNIDEFNKDQSSNNDIMTENDKANIGLNNFCY